MNDFSNKYVNANYLKGCQTYIGRIYFHPDYFEYKANGVTTTINFGKVHYSDIQSVKPVRSLGIIPNGILIALKTGNELRFVVNSRNAVIQYLHTKMAL